MDYFFQQLINGVALGAIYGLIAIGYTMVYGILGMINRFYDAANFACSGADCLSSTYHDDHINGFHVSMGMGY